MSGQNPKPTISGAFTAEENDRLRNAIDTVCAARDIEPKELVNIGDLRKDENRKFRGVWKEIAAYFSDRTQASVYRRGMRIINPFKTGSWTPEEIEHLQELYAEHGPKWSKFQVEINRSAESCADKYREVRDYVGPKSTKKRLIWNDETTEQLRVLIRDELGIEAADVSFAEMYAKVENEGIKLPFTAIAKKIGEGRTRLNCYERYLLMAGKKRKVKAKPPAGSGANNNNKKKRKIKKQAPGAIAFDAIGLDKTADVTDDADEAAAEAEQLGLEEVKAVAESQSV